MHNTPSPFTLRGGRLTPSDRPRHVRRRGASQTTLALVIAIVALVGAVGAIIYQVQIASPLRQQLDEQNAMIARLTGVANDAVRNTLDPRYTDADSDLVADAPADASKLIDPPVLKFSYVAVDDPAQFKSAFSGLMAAIAKTTGKQVEFVEFDSSDDQLRAIRDGRLHITALNTGAVPIGVCAAGFVPVAQMADESGAGGYHMEIIANADSDIRKLQDIRDHELAVTEPTSNSGYKAPLILLREQGLSPPRDYRLRYSQGHVNSIAGIKRKNFDAAAVAADVLMREVSAGRIAPNDFRSIYRSDKTFPTATMGYVHNLKPEIASKIRETVLSFPWKGSGLENQFGPEGKSKFVAVNYRNDWEYVRRIDESIGFPYQLKPAEPGDATPATSPTASTTQPTATR